MSSTEASPRPQRTINAPVHRGTPWRLLDRYGSFLLSLLILVLIWHLSTQNFNIPSYLLPAPADVVNASRAGLLADPFSRASFWYHLADTLGSTLSGFVIGSGIALVTASLMAEFRVVEKTLLPYMVGLQSMPKVAVAPLFLIWFGYGSGSKAAMAAALALFPVLMNTLQGLLTTPSDRLELMTAIRARRLQVFWRVKLPGALPYVFVGLNLGIVYALLGTIVGEFVGAQRGLGVVMTQLQASLDTAGVFAILIILAVVGYLLMTFMRWVQSRLTFWADAGPRDA